MSQDHWLQWDPSPVLFSVPYIEHPITYYSLCFVVGLAVGYAIVLQILRARLNNGSRKPLEIKRESQQLVDSLAWYIVIGMIVGARLGHVFFYDWDEYRADLISILYIWKGGLASHIGALGVLLALVLFWQVKKRQFPELGFLWIFDMVVIPTGFVAACIRVGNFINQEILGKVSTLPWAVVFLHPRDGSYPVPRHPVQLYEALCYLAIFAFCLWLWKKRPFLLGTGKVAGWFLLLTFGSRFFLEFLKESQSQYIASQSCLNMGQYLSLPFIALALLLIYRSGGKQGLNRDF